MSEVMGYLVKIGGVLREQGKNPMWFVAERGSVQEVSEPLTDEEHKIVADARRMASALGLHVEKKKQCFSNAQALVLADPTRTLRYCEGYALSKGLIPLPHGWVVLNGKVVDLTWGPTIGVIGDGCEYVGVEIPRLLLQDRMVATGTLGSMIDDWEHGFPLLKLEPDDPIENATWANARR